MFRHVRAIYVTIMAVFLAGAVAVKVHAGQSEKSTGTASSREEQPKRDSAAEAARQLLLLIDTDKTGKISKEEWMRFMEAEFDRLDTDHKGELDVKELTQSQIRVRPHVGK